MACSSLTWMAPPCRLACPPRLATSWFPSTARKDCSRASRMTSTDLGPLLTRSPARMTRSSGCRYCFKSCQRRGVRALSQGRSGIGCLRLLSGGEAGGQTHLAELIAAAMYVSHDHHAYSIGHGDVAASGTINQLKVFQVHHLRGLQCDTMEQAT